MNYSDYKAIDGTMFEKFDVSSAAKLAQNIQKINDLNVFPIPDGDTGDNMYRTISGGVSEMTKEPDASLGKKAHALSGGMLLSARGTSGVILSQIFSGMCAELEKFDTATLNDLTGAFRMGVKRAYETVVEPVEGTILTVARESVGDDVISSFNDNTTLGEYASRILERMRQSLANTPELLAVLKEAGVIDSGGAGLYYIAEGAIEAINGNAAQAPLAETAATAEADLSKFTEDSVFEYGYCTEFLLRLMRSKVDVDAFDENVITDYLSTIGDSIVAFKDGSIVKVHVHTMTPSKALEFCQKYGEFLTVKIENMMLQHNEQVEKKKESADTLPTAERKRIKYATCVVTSGSGIAEAFKEMGADRIIDGGQGKNPSINDFIEAFDKMNAENIFVFPNNSNILMAAEQAAKIYEKSAVFVIPSKNLGQAYASLEMLDYSFDTPELVMDNFISNMEYAETGTVCRAIRNYESASVAVKSDDYIGFTSKKILSSNADKVAALDELCEKLSISDREIATVIFGAEATESDRERVRALFAEKYSDKEYYEIDGNQEIYDFIIILE